MCNIHPLCLCKRHTDLPFEVKAPTRIPKEFADPRVAKQLLPTMSRRLIFVCLYEGKNKDVANNAFTKTFYLFIQTQN